MHKISITIQGPFVSMKEKEAIAWAIASFLSDKGMDLTGIGAFAPEEVALEGVPFRVQAMGGTGPSITRHLPEEVEEELLEEFRKKRGDE